MRRRHAEEAKRTQEERHRREQEYQKLFSESKRKASEAEDLLRRRHIEAEKAKVAREAAAKRVGEEEEKMRRAYDEMREDERRKEEAEWSQEEAEARRAAEEAHEELRRAREAEKKANSARAEAEEARRRSFNSNPSSRHNQTRSSERFVDPEEAWAKFEKRASSEAHIITLNEVPTITSSQLHGKYPSYQQREGVFKKLAKRWHPDKFLQKFGGQMVKKEEERIMERVKENMQVIQNVCQK